MVQHSSLESGGSVARQGRLTFQAPTAPTSPTDETGQFDLFGVEGAPPAAMYVPPVDGGEALRLVVMLHGAGGSADSGLGLLRREADRHRLLLLAPKSSGRTWDVIRGGYGTDVRNLDRLLAEVATEFPLRGCTIGGFSDGASYALSLGLANGDVFDSVIAFSPGFQAALLENGRPRIFVSHGTNDSVLPIDRCSRRLVPALERVGYDVTFHEFEGQHTVPAAVRKKAMEWLREAE